MGYAFVFVTLFYVASFSLTLGVARGSAVPDPAAMRASVLMSRPSRYRDLKDGLVHVATTPMLLAAMVLAFLINLCAYPVTSGLLPYVAERIFFVDARGLGWLVASFSFGGLLGSIVIVVTGGPRRPERSMLVHAALWYVLLLALDQRASALCAAELVRAVAGGGLPVPDAGDGRANARRLWDAARPDGRRRPHRARGLFAHGERVLRGRPRIDAAHRNPMARQHVAACARAVVRDDVRTVARASPESPQRADLAALDAGCQKIFRNPPQPVHHAL